MPASILTLGGIILPDSPNSLIERGKNEQGRKVLARIRGTQQVDAGAGGLEGGLGRAGPCHPIPLISAHWIACRPLCTSLIRHALYLPAEYEDICEAAASATKVSQAEAWRNLFRRQYRPSLVLATWIPTFQQWTGINAVGGGGQRGLTGSAAWPTAQLGLHAASGQRGAGAGALSEGRSCLLAHAAHALLCAVFPPSLPLRSCSTCPSSSPPWAPAKR